MVQPGNVDENKRATLRRFAVLGAATPLTKLADGDRSGERSEARDAIAGYVTTTPGAHFSKVRDDLQLGTGETQHHLRQLVELGVVESHRDGDYRRFFPSGQFSAFEQVALSYLRRDTPRGMMIELLRNPDATGGDLATALDVSRPTVSKYAADLDEKGLLSREDGYAVRHPETLITLLVRYADSFDANAEEFAAEAANLISFDP
ncbi:winged helix-turn-helix transcriptional regulator [Haladaptatus sp. CMAA 1911]|uniref:winged helix-turn-helix transcriptional regulator n=1 Tax=unclassified Haladaptatus TaxID=2622732 RepID=UPI003754F7D5